MDLPGYGYAKVPKALRASFQQMIQSYILERNEMTNLFILVDARHKPMQLDLDFINQMGEAGVPFSIILTKADKLSKSALQNNINIYRTELLKSWEELPPIFVTSSENGMGREELLTYIKEVCL